MTFTRFTYIHFVTYGGLHELVHDERLWSLQDQWLAGKIAIYNEVVGLWHRFMEDGGKMVSKYFPCSEWPDDLPRPSSLAK